MKKNYSDDFVIVRHYVWWNFVSANCPITRESLDVEDVVALINDVGEEYRDRSKRGYTEIPPYRRLKATTDRDVRALATKFLYVLLNFVNRLPGGKTRRCWREGFACEWVYPYGWVPEGGCPRHD